MVCLFSFVFPKHHGLCRALGVVALAFFMGMALPFAHAANGAGSPLAALVTAQKAIDTSDYTLFTQAVDIDAVLKNGIQPALKGLTQQAQKGQLQGVNPVLLLLLGSVDLHDPAKVQVVEQLLSSEVKTFVASGVSGGYFAGKPNGKGGSASALLEGLSDGRKELVGKKVLKESGNKATVTATLIDHGAGSFPLELGLARHDGAWRVVSIDNAKQLINDALAAAQ